MRKLVHLNPANYVIHVFGGVRPAARALGRDPSAVSRWSSRYFQGQQSGTIPTSAREIILNYAKQNGLPITSKDLDFGRKVKASTLTTRGVDE